VTNIPSRATLGALDVASSLNSAFCKIVSDMGDADGCEVGPRFDAVVLATLMLSSENERSQSSSSEKEKSKIQSHLPPQVEIRKGSLRCSNLFYRSRRGSRRWWRAWAGEG
jgi:hypothetical protein